MPVREFVLFRHGESTGNAARERALADGSAVIDIELRDADVPLTGRGRHQAHELGAALAAALPGGEFPVEVWSSPYRRALDTVAIALDAAGSPPRVRVDERLRDRELGILDRLTADGIRARFPDEADRRRFLGKLYYRPPGGESWSDVALRIRSFVADRAAESPPGSTVVVSTHDAVIMLFRYVLEELSEQQLMQLAAASVRNASLTRLVHDDAAGTWHAAQYDVDEHLSQTTDAPAEERADVR